MGMLPLVRGATAAAVLSALAGLDRGPPEHELAAAPPAARGVDGLPAPCAAGTLPEGPVCIRVPIRIPAASASTIAPESVDLGDAVRSHRGEPGFELIPRRPERPLETSAYLYPAGDHGAAAGPRILAGVERPGVRIVVRPAEIVHAVTLDHQVGPAEVVFVGDLFGPTVVTAHTIEAGSRKRTVLLFEGELDHAAAGVAPGVHVDAGSDLGVARSDLGAGLIAVYVEARELREGVKLDAVDGGDGKIDGKRLVDIAVAVPTDVRNVLTLR